MVTVGIDPHKHVHVAVAVGPDGRRIGKPFTVKNDALLITALLGWVRTIADGAPVVWAIEDGRGFARRLADGLLLAGHEVVWVPTRLTAAHRRLHAATGAKSDPVDAAAAARAAIAAPELARHRIDEHVRELRVLVDYRTDLIKRRTTLINQLKAQLHLWLDHTPGDLARPKGTDALACLLAAAHLGAHVRRVLLDMTAELSELNRRVHDLDATIKEIVSPLAPALLRSPASATTPPQSSSPRSATSLAFPPRPSSPATPAALPSPSTPQTKNATASTEAATAASTAFSTPRPSSRNASTQPPRNSWPAMNPPKANAAPAASFNATSSTSFTGQ